MNENDGQVFFDMLAKASSGDGRKMNKLLIGIVVAAFLVAVLALVEGSAGGALFMGGAGGLLLLIFCATSRSAKKERADGNYDFLKTYGVVGTKQEVIQQLNGDYAAGKLLFSRNDENMRAFLFPHYLVFSFGSTISVIAEEHLYWVHLLTQRMNGLITNHFVCLFTEQEEVQLMLAKQEDAEELIRQLTENYHMWGGFDENLRGLYRNDRTEFLRRMNEYKWYRKIPV